MAAQDRDELALQVGREVASEVLEFRAGALATRATAIQQKTEAGELKAMPAADPELIRAVGFGTAGTLVAEGDSWFDYPWYDVLRLLEDDHGFEVESVAHKGDRIEEMAYSGGQLEEFARHLEKLLRRKVIPRAVLLSGGGNDVAGREFGMLLNHARSGGIRGLNDQVVAGIIDERIRFAYVTILSAVNRVCEERIQRRLPILVHGYDHPVPDGRGFLGGWWVLPGPWLEPGFREKGYDRLEERISLAGDLIDRFNDMLAGVVELPELSNVVYLDLRGTLSTGDDYQDWWGNELHPTADGFERVANRFAGAVP
jgi:hypothetical protein